MATARPCDARDPRRCDRDRAARIRRRRRALRHSELGQGFFPRLRRRRPGRPPDAGGLARRGAQADRGRGRRARHRDADRHPLPADPLLRGREPERGLRPRDRRVRLRRRLPRRLPDQGQPEARRRRARSSRPAARYGYGLEAGSKPELLAAIAADLGPECLIICNGYKDDVFIRMALERASRMEQEGRPHPREGLRARAHPRRSPRSAACGRCIGMRVEALRARLGQVGQVGRRGRQVRPHDAARCSRPSRSSSRRQDARLPRHAPLPHRLADHRHPQDQGGDPRGRPRLREAARAWASRSST